MKKVNATSREINRAKMLKGRFLDRRMKDWMEKNYSKNIIGSAASAAASAR